MNEVHEIREQIIELINKLPDDKLKEVDTLLKKIAADEKQSIDHIYAEAVKKYDETLEKLAQ